MRKMYWLKAALLLALSPMCLCAQEDEPATAPQTEKATTPPPGIAVVQSPDAQQYFVASPSIVILPNGSYVVSHDWSGPGSKGSTRTTVYESTDRGLSWTKLSDVMDMRWSGLFEAKGSLWLFGVSKSYGPIHLRRSDDGGRTWTVAKDRFSGVLLDDDRYHTAPVPVAFANGRIYRGFEVQHTPKDKNSFEAFVLSAPMNSDWLKAGSWQKSSGISINKSLLNARQPLMLEGNAVVMPDGKTVANILRTESHPGKEDSFLLEGPAAGIPRFEVATVAYLSADAKTLTLNKDSSSFIHFPGAESKFSIRFDSVSKRYWALVSKITKMTKTRNFDVSPARQRNVVSLMSSPDLRNWKEHTRILVWNKGKVQEKMAPVGFQYLDFQFDGNDLAVVSRTGWYGVRSHDANYITFHRVANFRQLKMKDSAPDLAQPANAQSQ